MLKVYQFHMT